MLILTPEEVAEALPYAPLVDALERAFAYGHSVPERSGHTIELEGEDDATLLLMPAWQSGQALGVKIATIFPGNSLRGLPAVNATYLLLDPGTGEPLALLDGAELTARRTAAASALASRFLSRRDSARLLMVGTGKLAPQLVAAHASVRPITEVRVWGRRREAAEALSGMLADTVADVAPTPDLEAAVGNADIISCATLATEPLIEGRWLRPGQHLDLVGAFRPDMSEADPEALARAEVWVDTREGAMAEAGDVLKAIASGRFAESAIVGDLAGLAMGQSTGRSSGEAITLFKSVGTALEDLAAARLAISRRAGG